MSFEQAVHDEVVDVVENAMEDDGVITEQDREKQEIQNSLRILTKMYNHENEPGNTEWRNMVLVGITKAAIEHNQDPQEIANLVFWEGVLDMREFLWDAFEELGNWNKKIRYRLPSGDIMQWLYRQEQWIIEWTDLRRLSDTAAGRLGGRYMQNMIYLSSRVESFEEAVEEARQRIWWTDQAPLTADVRDTVSIDGNTDGEQVDELPPSITLDINPDGTVSILDENGREIELTFDELLARLATTHDKQWVLTQVENIKEAHINGVLNAVATMQWSEIMSQALKNIFENPNLHFSIDEIISTFSSLKYRYNPENLDLSFGEDTIRQIADTVFSEDWDLKWAGNDFRLALDAQSQEVFD